MGIYYFERKVFVQKDLKFNLDFLLLKKYQVRQGILNVLWWK